MGALKGTYLLQPHVDPTAIRWRYEGIQQVRLDAASGDLHLLGHNDRVLAEHAPVAWQDIAGWRVPVNVRYTQNNGTDGFALGAYDQAPPLTIDPTLVYSTYLGGKNKEYPYSIAADANGNVWIAGLTLSADFPTTAGAVQPQKSLNEDVFLAKLGSAGGGSGPGNPSFGNKLYLPFMQR